MKYKEEYIDRCNHNPNDIDNTLRAIPKANMLKPRKFYFQCTECKEMFAFLKEPSKAFIQTDL